MLTDLPEQPIDWTLPLSRYQRVRCGAITYQVIGYLHHAPVLTYLVRSSLGQDSLVTHEELEQLNKSLAYVDAR